MRPSKGPQRLLGRLFDISNHRPEGCPRVVGADDGFADRLDSADRLSVCGACVGIPAEGPDPSMRQMSGGSVTRVRRPYVPICVHRYCCEMTDSLEWECSVCHNSDGPAYLMLREESSPLADAFIGVWSSCPECHSEQPIGLPIGLVNTLPVAAQVSTIGMHLFERTGITVFRGRPENPPTGVREPRSQPPDEGDGRAEAPPA